MSRNRGRLLVGEELSWLETQAHDLGILSREVGSQIRYLVARDALFKVTNTTNMNHLDKNSKKIVSFLALWLLHLPT